MISVVIPAFNEADAVGEAVRQIEEVLAEVEHEIVVVDDGSQDATADEARAGGARVSHHPHNLGYGAALKTGIKAATYDTIVITDADGTYPNDLIPLLAVSYTHLRAHETRHDLVCRLLLEKKKNTLANGFFGYAVSEAEYGIQYYECGH